MYEYNTSLAEKTGGKGDRKYPHMPSPVPILMRTRASSSRRSGDMMCMSQSNEIRFGINLHYPSSLFSITSRGAELLHFIAMTACRKKDSIICYGPFSLAVDVSNEHLQLSSIFFSFFTSILLHIIGTIFFTHCEAPDCIATESRAPT